MVAVMYDDQIDPLIREGQVYLFERNIVASVGIIVTGFFLLKWHFFLAQ